MAAISSEIGVPGAPTCITVQGICEEPGLNGVYERNGNFRDGKAQWMKPGSRCYIRWIRERWEIYVSHHPAGTTYFFQPEDSDLPPLHGWQPSEALLPTESVKLAFTADQRLPASEAFLPAVATEVVGEGLHSPLVLWCNDTCPFVQRVAIALKEKGLQAQLRKVDLFGDRDPEFLAAFSRACPDRSRRAAIPILEVHPSAEGGSRQLEAATIIDSKVIVEYLEEAFLTAPHLMPAAATSRARVRLFIDAFERALGPCESAVLNAGDEAALAAASELLVEGLGVVERALKLYSCDDGVFICGDLFGIAEVFCAPQLQRLVTLLPHFRRLPCGAPMDVMAQRFPRLHAWTSAVLERQSVKSTYDFEAVVAVKSKAVATFQESGEGSRQETRSKSAAMLEGFFRSRMSASGDATSKLVPGMSGYEQAAPVAAPKAASSS